MILNCTPTIWNLLSKFQVFLFEILWIYSSPMNKNSLKYDQEYNLIYFILIIRFLAHFCLKMWPANCLQFGVLLKCWIFIVKEGQYAGSIASTLCMEWKLIFNSFEIKPASPLLRLANCSSGGSQEKNNIIDKHCFNGFGNILYNCIIKHKDAKYIPTKVSLLLIVI